MRGCGGGVGHPLMCSGSRRRGRQGGGSLVRLAEFEDQEIFGQSHNFHRPRESVGAIAVI